MANGTIGWKILISLLGSVFLLLTGCGAPEQEKSMELPLTAELAEQEKSMELPLTAELAEQQETVEQSQTIESVQEILSDEEGIVDRAAGEDRHNAAQWSLDAPYAKAYYMFLQDCLAQRAATEMEYRFRLVFIDDDAIPELLLFRNSSHAARVAIYTYSQDKMVELGEFGSFGKIQYLEKEGMIFDHYMGQGEALSYFWQLKDGEINVISRLHSWPEYLWREKEWEEYYEIDESPVTEESFRAKWDELYESQKYVLIGYEDGIPLEEDSLLASMAQLIDNLLWKRDSYHVLDQLTRQEEVLDAYGLLLEKLANERDAIPFTLIYLDGDDIPELAIIETHIAKIYTYDQDEAVLVGNYGITPEGTIAYREKEGIIFSEYSSSGGILRVHQINGIEDTVLQVFKRGWYFADGREDDIPVYEIDDTMVSQAQYDEKLREWGNSVTQKLLREDACTILRSGMDIKENLRDTLQTLFLTQYDTLRENVLIKSGLEEDAILLMDYDDFDGDGIYEAFAFCGKSYDYYGDTCYSGDFWFAGADSCVCLPERFGYGTEYRKIDGQMAFEVLGHRQKYLYYYSDYCFTANISGIWTVENGEPVEVSLPQSGQVVYRGQPFGFELWADGYNHYHELPTEEHERREDWEPDDMWFGHTYRPYFYHYEWEYGESGGGELKKDEGEDISREELERLCGFDLAGEVEAEGYEVTAIVRWKPSDIVTVNYTIPADEEDPFPVITYENIIWDCEAGDYWRREEWGVTSWKNAGVGGSI